MNETPTTESDQAPPEQPEQPSAQQGVNRDHLRHYEQLRRSIADRRVAGVAGGLGRHLHIDPTILRVLLVVLVFFGGAGLLLYGAAWLLVPEDGDSRGVVSVDDGTRNALLIVAGVVAALLLVGDSWGGFGFPWPLFLVGLGVLVYVLVKDTSKDRTAPQGWVAPPAGYPAAGQPSYQAPYQQPGYQQPTYQPPRPSPTKRGPKLFGATLALVLVALGSLGLYDATVGGVSDAAYPALALAVVGVVLVVGSFVGRAGGLILLGLIAAFALLGTSVFNAVGGRDLGEDRVAVTPATAADVRSTYTITSGRAEIDLSEVSDPEALAGRTLTLDGRAGELVVVLPEGVRTEVDADISGPGAIDFPDRNAGGIGTSLNGTYGEGSGVLTINADLNVGHIEFQETQ